MLYGDHTAAVERDIRRFLQRSYGDRTATVRTADHNISEAVDSPLNFNAEKYNATLTFATAAVGILRPKFSFFGGRTAAVANVSIALHTTTINRY